MSNFSISTASFFCSFLYFYNPDTSIKLRQLRRIVCTNSTILLRGTIVDRTYGMHKNLYILPLLLTIFGPINYGPP